MARPRAFDVDKAIATAMEVFWQHGYEEAGLAELCAKMGITRGSFYKAFGSKRALFLKALERYESDYVERGIALLETGAVPARERIATVFQGGIEAARSGDGRGCLLCNTAAGPALGDEAIRSAVSSQLERLTEAFRTALRDDPESAGEPADVRSAEAHRLTLGYVGLRVLGRGAFDHDSLNDAVSRLLLPYGWHAPKPSQVA
ncbi:MAG: TetR/AcrR family transcriptional regulator [Pseudomonadota bacterium]